MKIALRFATTALSSAAALALLTGCASTSLSDPAGLGTSPSGHALHGRVRGGQQPVSGATIALYAAGNTGYGSAFPYASGSSLLGTHSVQSDSNGNFNITGDYTCPSASTPVYIVGTSGDPGGGANPNLALMTALGPCGSLSSATVIQINEITTVASVWALAPFMSAFNIGTTPTNSLGLDNAFATVNKLVNISGGTLPGPLLPAGATLPIPKINTLADILAACVNSTGGTHGDGSACGTLFAAAHVGASYPSDTITAALNIARLPNQNVVTLFNTVSGAAPFQPTLISAPTDYAIVVTHTGAGISSPSGIAVDPSGNIWTANNANNSASKLNNLGAPLSSAAGFTAGPLSAPSAIAIDPTGNAWLTNANNTVVRLDPTGATGTVFSGANFNRPSAIAVDSSGNAWVANNGSSTLTQITSGGVQTKVTGGNVTTPVGIAIQPF
jgi:hypothetical protein